MEQVILVIHLILAVALVGVILVQRSEGGGLGIGGGSSGGGLVSSRAAGSLLTRTTGILAAGFMVTSLALALMANADREPASALEGMAAPAATETPAEAPVEPAPAASSPAPAVPDGPAVPVPD